MRFKYVHKKPSRDELHGMSASEFKTMLKQRGYKVGRDFFKMGSIASKHNRIYRFRYWGQMGEFFVDVSCPLPSFDRWANSTDKVVNFYNWLEQ